MCYKYVLSLMAFVVVLFSCKKDKNTPPPQVQVALLKDIVIPNLPSPYYHFEYSPTGQPIKASFASGIRIYDITYQDNKLIEMRNTALPNRDKMQYIYNESGKVDVIKYINEAGTLFRICFLIYEGQQLKSIEWEQKLDAGFIIDRTVSFTYYPDGNLKQMTDQRLPVSGQEEATHIDLFEQYDSKINTDGFSLTHNNNDHLLLLPGVQLQKNNARKLTRTGTGVHYTIDYTYTYSDKNSPLTKAGAGVFNNGPNAGQTFQSNSTSTYY